jgi:hypothetical protein
MKSRHEINHDYNTSEKGQERNRRYDESYRGRARKLRYEIEVRANERGGDYGEFGQRGALEELERYLASDAPARGLKLYEYLNEVHPLPKLKIPSGFAL